MGFSTAFTNLADDALAQAALWMSDAVPILVLFVGASLLGAVFVAFRRFTG